MLPSSPWLNLVVGIRTSFLNHRVSTVRQRGHWQVYSCAPVAGKRYFFIRAMPQTTSQDTGYHRA
ncbi:MAG: hypothetical protein Q7J06_02815, partial [Bacteroidales bacterium]|nr:hypothetical protein [Bacteroidales bacterium]